MDHVLSLNRHPAIAPSPYVTRGCPSHVVEQLGRQERPVQTDPVALWGWADPGWMAGAKINSGTSLLDGF